MNKAKLIEILDTHVEIDERYGEYVLDGIENAAQAILESLQGEPTMNKAEKIVSILMDYTGVRTGAVSSIHFNEVAQAILESLQGEGTEPVVYDKNFGDNRICECGHTYVRHFDPYENYNPIGCKYCDCSTFKEPQEEKECEYDEGICTFGCMGDCNKNQPKEGGTADFCKCENHYEAINCNCYEKFVENNPQEVIGTIHKDPTPSVVIKQPSLISDEAVEELIKLYDEILYGSEKYVGLFDCYDTYYRGCWDEKLKKVENLKQQLKE